MREGRVNNTSHKLDSQERSNVRVSVWQCKGGVHELGLCFEPR